VVPTLSTDSFSRVKVELVGAYSNHAVLAKKLADLRKQIEDSEPRNCVRRIRRQKAPHRLSNEEISELVQGYGSGLTTNLRLDSECIVRQCHARWRRRESYCGASRSQLSKSIKPGHCARKAGRLHGWERNWAVTQAQCGGRLRGFKMASFDSLYPGHRRGCTSESFKKAIGTYVACCLATLGLRLTPS
jgi:hypothetical protein